MAFLIPEEITYFGFEVSYSPGGGAGRLTNVTVYQIVQVRRPLITRALPLKLVRAVSMW